MKMACNQKNSRKVDYDTQLTYKILDENGEDRLGWLLQFLVIAQIDLLW